MKKKHLLLSIILLCILFSLTACGRQNSGNSSTSDGNTQLSGKHHVAIEVNNYGTIEVELDADTAPITGNGLTFHRIIKGFMIQGGDPNGDGTGGSSEKIKGEFKSNGVQNNISHIRGTISMARSSANNSASSQFFIMQKDTPSLDGQYAAFGTVTSGMDIVDKICKDCTDTNQNGVITDKSKQPVISTIRVVD